MLLFSFYLLEQVPGEGWQQAFKPGRSKNRDRGQQSLAALHFAAPIYGEIMTSSKALGR